MRFHGNYSVFNNLMDYTYTYRKDSDICKRSLLNTVIPLSVQLSVVSQICVFNMNHVLFSYYVEPLSHAHQIRREEEKNYAYNKTKMAVWFVSNCDHAPSYRFK